MSSGSDDVETHQQSTEKNSEQTLDRCTTAMADNDEKQHDHDIWQQSGSVKDVQYATSFKLAAIMVTINLSTMVAALDLGIVATAIPAITEEFQSLDQIAWYSAACFILVGATSATWGKLFTYFPAPLAYMSALVLYLIGSVVAAAAPNSVALIVGRAIQGWGCSGTLSGSVLIISFTAAPKNRPLLIGVWMGVFMGATVLGPLLGGVFTSTVTWRWCFWINLPIGGLALVLQLFFLRVPKHIKPMPATWKEIMLQLDVSGLIILTASLVSYTLALERGGLTSPWSDGTVVATLVVWIVLTIAFLVNEWLLGTRAMMPIYLLKTRMTWASCLYAWIANCANFQVLFYLPIYFQSVKGDSAIMSGVYTLPFVCFYALGSFLSGLWISKSRLPIAAEIVSPLLALIGAILFEQMDIDTAKAWYVGAQIPFGFGIGLGNQVPVTALQSFSKPEEVAATMGIIFTCQTVSGAYFATAAQSVFENTLYKNLAATGISAMAVNEAGAAGLSNTFSGRELTLVLEAYMAGIHNVFIFAVAGATATVLVALLIPPTRIPSHEEKNEEDEEAGDASIAK
ncbi:hypothetical protein N0V93_006988 [Gnomoniopsis smithogilvyi]|uniref:Major facilitator superfamily (MFS) profile domain-containing protein n=1 Tax=Gnomoniopsis smithogilvyi TaxID=1191159 RepID=A0A9W8YSR4_9PEZI|nr:hypothetical protein N0V93_006988 [Gnomoniopsis smithogilvyi]